MRCDTHARCDAMRCHVAPVFRAHAQPKHIYLYSVRTRGHTIKIMRAHARREMAHQFLIFNAGFYCLFASVRVCECVRVCAHLHHICPFHLGVKPICLIASDAIWPGLSVECVCVWRVITVYMYSSQCIIYSINLS